MPSPPLLLAVGFLAAFIGTLPFGPINLSVVDATLRKDIRAGLWLSLPASLVEILMAYLALHCSHLITNTLSSSPWAKWVAIALFIGLGLLFWLRKPVADESEKKVRKGGSFMQGLLVSMLNPQAIPFWIFVLTFFESSYSWSITSMLPLRELILFLLGVAIGKFAALAVFAISSHYIKGRSQFLRAWMNKIIGGILILLGLGQAITLVI